MPKSIVSGAKDFVRNNFLLWFPCSAWEPVQGRSSVPNRRAVQAAFPRGAWERCARSTGNYFQPNPKASRYTQISSIGREVDNHCQK